VKRRASLLVVFVMAWGVALVWHTVAAQTIPPELGQGWLPEFTLTSRQLLQLADATPAEKFAWRPGSGVRSISEVYMHIAGANYYLSTFLGKTPPADVPKDIEKIKDKQRVLSELKKSFDYIRGVVQSEKDEDLEKSVKMFGNTTTRRAVLLTVLTHAHEHLGQSIAYARMNGVVPPWSGR
jgi:uncharacterized damage-inducible protein DinB